MQDLYLEACLLPARPIPMIVRWPGIILPGRTSDHVSAFWDVLPTLVELAGGEIPAGTDGISFLPELLGRIQPQHDYLYWEFHEQGGRKALVSGKWKAVQNHVNTIPPGAVELYDLDADPGETCNLASSYPDRVHDMEELMGSARTSSANFTFTP
ncbi:MAG TPA: sulfatase/phosphatase domain-containing protein [Bacteroidales bacterium]|nr:sulfatase/phosphatase domain-containing protein [Bacteroidales bacterium]